MYSLCVVIFNFLPYAAIRTTIQLRNDTNYSQKMMIYRTEKDISTRQVCADSLHLPEQKVNYSSSYSRDTTHYLLAELQQFEQFSQQISFKNPPDPCSVPIPKASKSGRGEGSRD